jgi:hypothetical protein
MEIAAVLLFWLVAHSHCFPLSEENSLEPEDDRLMYSEAISNEVG